MKPKRLRAPNAKPGELKAQWGKLRHCDPDLCFAWGEGCSKRDAALLNMHFGSERPDPLASPIFSKMIPSLLAELESRGYDVTTFKFSIQKRAE